MEAEFGGFEGLRVASECCAIDARRLRKRLEQARKRSLPVVFVVDSCADAVKLRASSLGGTTLRRDRADQTKKKTKKKAAKAKGPVELIISKSRTKGAVKKSNVSSEFYGALDQAVRGMIASAEGRASANGRKTLRPQDL